MNTQEELYPWLEELTPVALFNNYRKSLEVVPDTHTVWIRKNEQTKEYEKLSNLNDWDSIMHYLGVLRSLGYNYLDGTKLKMYLSQLNKVKVREILIQYYKNIVDNFDRDIDYEIKEGDRAQYYHHFDLIKGTIVRLDYDYSTLGFKSDNGEIKHPLYGKCDIIGMIYYNRFEILNRTPDSKYEFFEDGPLSNEYLVPFKVDGVSFNCSEQYIMYMKAITFNDEETAKDILLCEQPHLQKKLGRLIEDFDSYEWDKVKYDLVKKGIREKFLQNPDLMDYLLERKDKIFAKATAGDEVWSIGFSKEDALKVSKHKWGENLLGKILNELADEFSK